MKISPAHPLRPKVLKKIRQERLSARELLRCVCHTLNVLDVELRVPDHILRPLDVSTGERRLWVGKQAFLWSPTSGNAHWDSVQEHSASDLRLVIQPDEGSPMCCVVQYLQSRGHRILLWRDSLWEPHLLPCPPSSVCKSL